MAEITIHGYGTGELCTCPVCGEFTAVRFPAKTHTPEKILCRSNSDIICGFYGTIEDAKELKEKALEA